MIMSSEGLTHVVLFFGRPQNTYRYLFTYKGGRVLLMNLNGVVLGNMSMSAEVLT